MMSMRWILPGLATVLLLAQEPLPVIGISEAERNGLIDDVANQKQTPAEQLEKQIAKLKNDLKRLRKINQLKDAFEAAKRALAEERLPLKEREKLARKRAREAKHKKARVNKQPKKPPYRWEFMPNPMPALLVGEARVLQDVKGMWWVVKRDNWNRIGLNQFGPAKDDKEEAMKWVRTIRAGGFIK